MTKADAKDPSNLKRRCKSDEGRKPGFTRAEKVTGMSPQLTSDSPQKELCVFLQAINTYRHTAPISRKISVKENKTDCLKRSEFVTHIHYNIVKTRNLH
ncbi:hypothetical protein TNIN_6301 [Trichonephila inaurata madagascariensis]|uniref:Uncharacterized protein n=1 Tax=Trichonephila inaurata madagascariensis TaxID=2747483 RepID=A0A8X6WSV0_9ARAC|nr:hypothetical protein TNIN_6301 [Trichonephila inaurata madagascariensis]